MSDGFKCLSHKLKLFMLSPHLKEGDFIVSISLQTSRNLNKSLYYKISNQNQK